MLLKVFAVFDSGVQSWLPPIFARNNGEMMRSFIDACNSETKFAKHPADYTLFEVGSWEDDKCKFDLLKSPISLCMAQDCIKKLPSVYPKESTPPGG